MEVMNNVYGIRRPEFAGGNFRCDFRLTSAAGSVDVRFELGSWDGDGEGDGEGEESIAVE